MQFFSPNMDNVNSLLVGMPTAVLRKLQMIQNNDVSNVLRKKKGEHIIPLMKQLHIIPLMKQLH